MIKSPPLIFKFFRKSKGGLIILEFVTTYWLEVLFGVVTAGLSWLCKRFQKMYKSEKFHQKTEEQKAFYAGINKTIEDSFSKVALEQQKTREDLDSLQEQLNNLKKGLLDVQSKEFRDECYRLLQEGHIITLDEYNAFEEKYDAYKGLGGNHTGDALHERVVEKFAHGI